MVNARAVVKAVGESDRDELHQVAVADLVFSQQHQVGRLLVDPRLLIQVAARREIDFTADDRLETLGQHRIVKVDHAVEDAMIGDGTGLHAQRGKAVGQVAQADRPVEQGVFGMQVQVGKCCDRHDASSSRTAWILAATWSRSMLRQDSLSAA